MKKIYPDEQNLLEHLINGEEEAYAYLIELYYDNLCDYASNLTRDSFSSEDIVQNVIVRMWKKRKKLNIKISIKNYLYKSVYNEFVDHYRKDMSITALEKKYIEGLDSFTEIQEDDNLKHLIDLVECEIEQLPKKCKETFLLSKQDGLTYIEIAEYLNVSVNTVEKHMVKAFAILRKKVKEKVSTFWFLLFSINEKMDS